MGTIEDIELVKSSLSVEYELHSNKKWTSFLTFKQPEHIRSSLGLLIIIIEILGVFFFKIYLYLVTDTDRGEKPVPL